MSKAGFVGQLRELLRDRWQVPAAIAAALAASVTVYRLFPKPVTLDLPSLLAEIALLEESGAVTDAADSLGNLLAMDPPLPPEQQAIVHDRLAELIYRREQQKSKPSPQNLALLLEHHEAAERLGQPQTAGRQLRAAQTAEWLGMFGRAVPGYRQVLELDPTPEQKRVALLALGRLLRGQPQNLEERQQVLEALLSDEGLPTPQRWWALHEAMGDALEERDAVRARLLLDRYGQPLKASDLKGYWEYLSAWVLIAEGRAAEARAIVEWVDEWLRDHTEAQREMNRQAHLPALNRWLAGQTLLSHGEAEAAVEAFDEALRYDPPLALATPARAGKAAALARLGQHPEAQQVLHEAIQAIRRRGQPVQAELSSLREKVVELAQACESQGDYENAAPYLELAIQTLPADESTRRLELLERLAHAHELAATTAADPESRLGHLQRAAESLERAAELCPLSETDRQGGLLWSAAQLYEQCEQRQNVRRVLLRFLEGRLEDPRLPQAYVLLGRSLEAMGGYEEALQWLRRVADAYPGLADAHQALLAASRCLEALGRDSEAEGTLERLLSDELLTPQARIFREALLALGELHYRQGRFAQAIGRLEEFLTLYPASSRPSTSPGATEPAGRADPETYRALFLLADAYRRSGRALCQQPPPDADPAAARTAGRDRLRQAATLFEGLAAATLELPEALSASGENELALYPRLALIYAADCQFELNEPDSLEKALQLYGKVAVRYEREPLALTAQVQIAAIHLRAGRLMEAARALERARWLARNIPQGAFDSCFGTADRNEWERYLGLMLSTNLLQGVLAGSP